MRFSQLILEVVSDPRSIEPQWRRLEALSMNSLHQGFDWSVAWIQAHESNAAIIHGHVDGETALILPLEIVSETGGRIARFPGGRFNNVNTGLYAANLALPDREELHNFAYGLKQVLRDRVDLIVLDSIPLNWRGKTHPLAGLATIENQNHSFQLPLFANFEATLAQLNAKTRRKKFRTSTRRLEAVGGFDHVIATEAEEKHSLLELFFHQKSERLTMFGLPNVFESAEVQRFFHTLLDVDAASTDAPLALHAVRLKGEHEGHIAAIAGISRKGDYVICQFSSIDDSICADASPGELLFWLMIEHCCHTGASTFDFGMGDQPYKRNWCRQETIHHDILLPLTWKGSLIRPLLVGMTKAKARIKQSPRLYAMAQRWRSRRRPQISEASASDA
jgi:CelD/BcsL family acetyltransferase involved in cellulose biosynthesis